MSHQLNLQCLALSTNWAALGAQSNGWYFFPFIVGLCLCFDVHELDGPKQPQECLTLWSTQSHALAASHTSVGVTMKLSVTMFHHMHFPTSTRCTFVYMYISSRTWCTYMYTITVYKLMTTPEKWKHWLSVHCAIPHETPCADSGTEWHLLWVEFARWTQCI